MPPIDAVYLDNWFPRQDGVAVRGGFASYASLTGIAGDVETLETWNGGTGSKLWALASTGAAVRAFECSTAGVKAADAGFTALAHAGAKAQYSAVMFNNVAGYFLHLCDENAVNPPAQYNGAAWTAPAWTGAGLAITNLCQVSLFKYRLIFCEAGKLDFWYAPQDTLAGPLAKFRLGGYCNEGGYLMATGRWTVDAGDGADDRFIAITSNGQILVFEGDDPSSANGWGLVGTFKCAPPIGRKCLFNYGGDLFIVTIDGLVSLSAIMNASDQNPATPITDKVRGAFQQAARDYGAGYGWKALYYPRGRFVLINVPQTTAAGGVVHQYVMNSQTRSWCRFKAQNAKAWALFNNGLYFGDVAGNVRFADSAAADNGGAIVAQAKQAYNYFDDPQHNKLFAMVRPSVQTEATSLKVQLTIDVDFASSIITPSVSTIGSGGAAWDTTDWDTQFWDAGPIINADWASVAGYGRCASVIFGVSLNGASMAWFATEWLFQNGGVI